MSDVTITEERLNDLCDKYRGGIQRIDPREVKVVQWTEVEAMAYELLRHRAQAGWVPVSERLPTAAGFYLVTGSTDEGVPFVWTSSFTPNIGTKHPPYWSANEVIAWQELRFPAPYKVTP